MIPAAVHTANNNNISSIYYILFCGKPLILSSMLIVLLSNF